MSSSAYDIAVDNRNRLNAIVENSKENDELPLMTVLEVLSKFRVTINGESKALVFQTILDYFQSLGYITTADIYQTNSIITATYHWVEDYTYKIVYVKWVNESTVTEFAFNQNIILDTAHATLDRLDALVLNTDNGTVYKKTGTPASEPSLPSLEPYELLITFVPVDASSSSPSGVGNINIYIDNAEWIGVVNSGLATFNDTTNPLSGTYNIKASGGDDLSLSGSQDVSSVTYLLINVKLLDVLGNKTFKIKTYDNSNILSQIAIGNGDYGLDGNNTTDYQTLIIPASVLGLVTGITLEKIDFTFQTGFPDVLMDDIYFQTGTQGGINLDDFLPRGGYQGTAQDLYDLILAGGLTPEQLAKLNALNRSYDFAVNNESEDLVVDAVVPIYTDILREPFAGWNNTRVTASAPDGDILEFEIYVNGVLKDTVSIDSLETDSADAATPPAVIGAPIDLVAGDKIEVFCTNIGSTTAGGAFAKMSLQHI